MMKQLPRYLFFLLLVKLIVFFLLGIRIHFPERLPSKGPAIIVANHNSHLDTLILISLFPMHMLTLLRPVAAADYFLRNKYLAWFSKHLIGILPIERNRATRREDPFKTLSKVLSDKGIVIFSPKELAANLSDYPNLNRVLLILRANINRLILSLFFFMVPEKRCPRMKRF